MEAAISGQAGVALLVDGDVLSSIHVHDIEAAVARRPGEFHYLFGAASDLVFVEDISADDVRQELQSAADGEDVTQLTLLLLAADRQQDIRQTAAEELAEVLTTNADAADFAERILLSTTLPHNADLAGAQRLCADTLGGELLLRLQRLQPFVRLVREAWRTIPEDYFGFQTEDCRVAANAVFVREGVVRDFVLAAAGEMSFGDVVYRALPIPAVRSLTNRWLIVTKWKSGLPNQPIVSAEDISAALANSIAPVGVPAGKQPETPSTVREELEHIRRVLADCGGNVSEAARRLSTDRRSLQRKLRNRAP